MEKKVLIVEDDPVIVRYLETLLLNNGFKTATAYDGNEAMSVAEHFNPDLITLDLEMPKEWGPRFYRRLSRKKNLNSIPVIVISGLSGRENAINKAAGVFSKPFDPEKVVRTIIETIGSPDV